MSLIAILWYIEQHRFSPPSDRNELEAAQKFLEQAAIEHLVSLALLVPDVIQSELEVGYQSKPFLISGSTMQAWVYRKGRVANLQ